MSKKRLWIKESVCRGKSGVHGAFYRHKHTEELIYISEKRDRRTGIFHRTNSLAIDVRILEEAKIRGVKFVVVRIKSTGDLYATTLKRFESEIAMSNLNLRDGSLQRCLPISEFVERKSEKLKL